MKTSLSSKGQIVLPAELRKQDHIRPGQQFEVKRLKAGKYLLSKVADPGEWSLLKWLQSCPEKDWFQPMPRTDTTDDIGRGLFDEE